MQGAPLELVFEIELDEAGNYCAFTVTERGALATSAESLDELLPMIVELLARYRDESGTLVTSFSLRFTPDSVLA